MEKLRERELMPGFRLKSTSGDLIGPQDYRGKKNVVLILFTADCVPCLALLREAAENYRDYVENDAQVMAVGDYPESDLRDLAEGLDLPFPVLSDPDRVVFREISCGSSGVIVIDQFGEARFIQYEDESGQMPSHKRIIDRLQLIALECPECGVPTWPV